MEDSDLAMLALIIAGGGIASSLFVMGFFFPMTEHGVFNLAISMLIGLSLGFLYFFGSKRSATGYFKLPDDLKELHRKVKEIEEYKL